jgi:uncharacterized iron-regulated membrane protein
LKRARQFWLVTHRWLGVGLGVVFAVLGLSGSFLAFYPEIDVAFNPTLLRSTPSSVPASLDDVVRNAAPACPDKFLHSVSAPYVPGGAWHVWFIPQADGELHFDEVLVDTSDARILGARRAVPVIEFTRKNLTNTIYTLHMQLFLGDAGGWIVGAAGLALLVSGVTGLVLWWPRGRGWRDSLLPLRGAGRWRRNFDLHRLLGLYSAAALATAALTGTVLVFNDLARAALSLVSPVTPDPVIAPSAALDAARRGSIGPQAAVDIARHTVPGARLDLVWMPSDSLPVYRVSLLGGERGARDPSSVWVRACDGEVLAVRRHAEATAGDRALAWTLPLHNGRAAGMPGRALVCLVGLLIPVISLSGIYLWWRKRKTRCKLSPSQHPA